MNTMIQFEHIPSIQPSVATAAFDSIDPCLLTDIAGGKGNNFLTRFGENMQKGGEYAMAAGAVGTVVPGLGETGIPEGVAAGGGASWLIGKGAQALGNLF